MNDYQVGINEKVVELDHDLKRDLLELKEAVEEVDLLYNSGSTIRYRTLVLFNKFLT